jgi:alkylation response protein AidB-like acyl-CoA dehydrogenase
MGDSEEIKSGIIPREEVKIIEDWKTVGMKNTSTNSIEIVNVFIPNEHIFSVYDKKSQLNETVFNLPFIIYAQAFFISVAFGIFKRLLDETEKTIKESETYNDRQSNRLLKMSHLNAKGVTLLEDAKNEISEIINILIEQPNIDSNTSNKIQERFIFHANILRTHALEMFVIHGINAVYAENPINVFFNDLLAVTQHKLMNEVVE